MPHATLKLMPGVDQNRTPTLNEQAISQCQFIRFVADKQGIGLVQKLGGWTKFFPSSVGSVVRALWAWQDTGGDSLLGLGSQPRAATITGLVADSGNVTVSFSGFYEYLVGETIVVQDVVPTDYNGAYTITAETFNPATNTGTVTFVCADFGPMTTAGGIYAGDGLSTIRSSTRRVITPRTQTADVAVDFETTLGSPEVIATASGSLLFSTDAVYIKTQVSVGGLILFGVYPATYVNGTNQFIITALDPVGDPLPATATVSPGGGAVPVFDFTSGESVVLVTLDDHGFFEGDSFPVLVPTTAGGVTLSGNYSVVEVVSANQFTIRAQNAANATVTYSMNGGDARFTYYRTPGELPTSTGYGVGGYGLGGYGTGVAPTVSASGSPIYATDWTLDNWGRIFVSCPVGGGIYTLDPDSGSTQASLIPQAPPVNDGMFVAMPQRQIIAWGSTFNGVQDPLLIRWCEVDDYNQWIALPTNQAGSYRMPKGSKVVGCIQGPQQGLIWTDLAVWAMQYVGPPYIYQVNEIGNGCGLIARKAAASMNGVVYWMSQSQFFRLAGSGVEAIQCPIWDVIFQDIDMSAVDSIRIAPNSRFGEIAWYYPTIGSGGEVTKYVKHNVLLGTWDFGTLNRTAWINQSVLGPPVGAGTFGTQNYIYQHETSPDADGQPMTASFTTGYSSISDGEWKTFVDQVWPDMKWGYYGGAQDADLTLTFYVTDYPSITPRVYGPFAVNNQTTFVTPRFRGRLVALKMESTDLGSFWRIGGMRYRYQQDGKF